MKKYKTKRWSCCDWDMIAGIPSQRPLFYQTLGSSDQKQPPIDDTNWHLFGPMKWWQHNLLQSKDDTLWWSQLTSLWTNGVRQRLEIESWSNDSSRILKPYKSLSLNWILFYSNHLLWRVKWLSPFPYLPVFINFPFGFSLRLLEMEYHLLNKITCFFISFQ